MSWIGFLIIVPYGILYRHCTLLDRRKVNVCFTKCPFNCTETVQCVLKHVGMIFILNALYMSVYTYTWNIYLYKEDFNTCIRNFVNEKLQQSLTQQTHNAM